MVTCEFHRLVPISELGPSLPPRKPVQEKGRTRKSGPTLGLAAWAPTPGPCPGQAAGLALPSASTISAIVGLRPPRRPAGLKCQEPTAHVGRWQVAEVLILRLGCRPLG